MQLQSSLDFSTRSAPTLSAIQSSAESQSLKLSRSLRVVGLGFLHRPRHQGHVRSASPSQLKRRNRASASASTNPRKASHSRLDRRISLFPPLNLVGLPHSTSLIPRSSSSTPGALKKTSSIVFLPESFRRRFSLRYGVVTCAAGSTNGVAGLYREFQPALGNSQRLGGRWEVEKEEDHDEEEMEEIVEDQEEVMELMEPWTNQKTDDVEKIVFSLETKHMYDVSENALGNVRLLLQLGAKRGQVLRVMLAQPELLLESVDEEVRDKAGVFWTFSVPPPVLVKAIGRSLTLDWLATPRPQVMQVMEFLDKELGVNNLANVVESSPHVLALPLEEVKETVEYLQSLQVWDVGAALDKNPAMLGWGREDVAEKVDVLQSIVGGEGDVGSMLERSPAFMAGSVASARATFAVLVEKLGEEGAEAVVASRPRVLAMQSLDMEQPLTELVALFGREVAASIVAVNVNLAKRRWEKTAQKMLFLTGEMGRSVQQVGEWPTVLSYDLKMRIRRRFEALKQEGKGQGESLRAIFGCSDSVFERRFALKLPKVIKGKRGRKPKNQSPDTNSA